MIHCAKDPIYIQDTKVSLITRVMIIMPRSTFRMSQANLMEERPVEAVARMRLVCLLQTLHEPYAEDQRMPTKQQHSAKRWEDIADDAFHWVRVLGGNADGTCVSVVLLVEDWVHCAAVEEPVSPVEKHIIEPVRDDVMPPNAHKVR